MFEFLIIQNRIIGSFSCPNWQGFE